MYKEFIKTATVKAKLFERGDEDGIVHGQPFIKTLENDAHYGHFGKHYLCTGIDGERWLVEKSIFERTYEEISNTPPPLKPLSEITDEHASKAYDILYSNGYGQNWPVKYKAEECKNVLQFNGGYPCRPVADWLAFFQYLSQFYQLPVFYPVPEVKEKGEVCEICNGSGKHPLLDSPCVECQKEKGENNE